MNKQNKKVIAQGDVLIIPIDTIPNNVKTLEREDGAIILAHGEVTGHAHRIFEENVDSWVDEKDNIWLEVKGLLNEVGAIIKHEEHSKIDLKPGKYKVVKQREYVAPTIKHRPVAD